MPNSTNQRSFILIGAALALPIVVLVVIQLLFSLDRERRDVERRTLARAEQVMSIVTARVEADLGIMRVLASSDSFERRRWPEAYARAREVAALNPHWRTVIVSNLDTGEQVFDLRQPYSAAHSAIAPAAATLGAVIGGAAREGSGCPCVYVHQPVGGGGARLLLTVALDPIVFREALMRHVPEGAIAAIVDADGNFIARSAQHTERVGTPATQFVRNRVASGERSGLYVGTTYEGFRNYTAFYRADGSGWSAHIAVASSLIDGPRLYSYVTMAVGALITLGLAAGLIAYALRDLAVRRQAEARLAQTQKLEAIGQLTGGVAHDFNNLLTVMIGGLNMLLRRMDDQEQRQIAEQMLEAAQRGDRLTKQLLAFSRGQRMELAPVDLHKLAPGMEELLRRSIDPGTTLAINPHPEARWVLSDANQLELAILNLVINARDAMPEGGRIEIATRPAPRPDTIEVSVSDTGIGMPKDVADRALEPFFTTKPAGKGTGLGLSQVYGAVRQSGGHVEIDSAPGRGTVVRLTLPRAQAPAQDQTVDTESAPALANGDGQRILVVDDEPGVRGFMAETLRDAGYDAVEAEDVGVALRLLEASPPDLLLTDYSMPGMNGLELAERARGKDAQVRVLIVSGYADALAIEASAARPVLLRKPFDERVLLEAVRSVLSA